MPVGTPVHAARSGIVHEIKYDSNETGRTKDFINKANFVKLKHSDDTYTFYAHLKFKGILVKLGEKVKEGQLLALSGNTGYSDMPHLHFEVYKLNKGSRESQRFKFFTHRGVIGNLSRVGSYKSVTNLNPCP
jgi:murein DD-endopeptidase MepM/ murein hydrolase activator NlpD